MCLRHVVESENAPAQLEKEVCAKRDQGPERKLVRTSVSGLPSCHVRFLRDEGYIRLGRLGFGSLRQREGAVGRGRDITARMVTD